jgi:GntR family transcriptional repressor for pyruvate dehydrogenase complex
MQNIKQSKKTSSQQVVEYIKEQITFGLLKAGDKLPSERNLQEIIGISRFALREGLARLSALGIVTTSHGRASVISKNVNAHSISDIFLPLLSKRNQKYIDDLIEVRIAIDQQAIKKAIQHITEEHIEELKQNIDDAEKNIDMIEYFSEKDIAFHLKIAEISNNSFFINFLEAIHAQIKLFINKSITFVEQREKALQWHKDILQSIIDRNIEKAQALIYLHILDCKDKYEYISNSENE